MNLIRVALLAAAYIGMALQGFGLGLERGGDQLPSLWRRPGLFGRFFLATFVVMPAIVLLMRAAVGVPRIVWIGLLLIAVCPTSAGLGAKLRNYGGDLRIGLAWQGWTLLLSLFTIPITVLLVERGLGFPLGLPLGTLIERVLLLMAIPELLGFALARRWPQSGRRVAAPAKRLSGILLGIVVVLALLVTATKVTSVSLTSWLFILVFSVLAVGVGLLLGAPPANLRPTLAAALSTRWPMPVIVLAQMAHAVLAVLPVIAGYLVFGTMAMMVYGKLQAPRQQAEVLPKAA